MWEIGANVTKHSLSLTRWQRLCQQFGIDDRCAIKQEFQRIARAYSETHRAYHTAQHINECLSWLDWSAQKAAIAHCASLEMALWYHDRVYQPQLNDNEQRSAEQAVTFLNTHNVHSAQVEQVEMLILATGHWADSKSDRVAESVNWMVDIDLAILGAVPQRFLQYNSQIHQEYGWLPDAVYQARREQVLSAFLARPTIYQTGLFQAQIEIQARENLLAAIGAL
ncbi:MAG: N-methyl-D-aspartate receptor NMDAR2C subunit [Cyanobacteria bacterium P01_H01_bin.21]